MCYPIAYGFGQSTHRGAYFFQQDIHFLESEYLHWQEKHTKFRPLIFIGHSFGGVVIEQVKKCRLVPSQP